MTTLAPRSAHHRWCDVDGTHIVLFCWVEQIRENREPGVLPSRLHQRGQILGVGLESFLESLYVCFSDNALVSLPPHLRVLMPTTLVTGHASDPASATIPIVIDQRAT